MEITRRKLLSTAAVAVHPLIAAPRARVELTKTISAQGEFYHGWPTLIRRKNGQLMIAYSGGREDHVCPFGRVEIIRSADDGESWSWPEVVMDSPIDDRDAGLCETVDGSLVLTTFTSLAFQETRKRAASWPPDKTARWDAVAKRASEADFQSLLGTWMLRSTDGGLSWSQPYRVPLNSPHGPSVLANGRLLYAGKQLWEPGKKVGVCESADDGRNWRWLNDIPVRAGDTMEQYHELHQVQTPTGKLIVHIRNHSEQNHRETLQCESVNGGKTWSTPVAIGVWGLPSQLLRLRNGMLLMSYGYRRSPFGNQARVSRDEGRTWSQPLILSEDGAGVDLGYPSTVELANGKLLTVWYESTKDSPHAVLRMARWTLDS